MKDADILMGEGKCTWVIKLHLPKCLRKTLLGNAVFITLKFYFLTITSFSGDTFT